MKVQNQKSSNYKDEIQKKYFTGGKTRNELYYRGGKTLLTLFFYDKETYILLDNKGPRHK